MNRNRLCRYWIGLLALILGALVLGACKNSVGLKFSHRFHLEKQELGCDQCHPKDQAGNPAPARMASCQECHEFNLDEPDSRCLLCHTPESAKADYAITPVPRPAGFTDLIFSHDPHADIECAHCHQSVAKDHGLAQALTMDTCTSCHKVQEGPLDCASCHKALRADQAPADHAQDWEKKHGFASRLSTACFYCHSDRQEFCEKCHRTEKPADHNFGWKTTGHGIEATHDRRSCAVCHDAGYCIDCHKHQKPVSHFRGDWMSYQRENGHAEAARHNFRSCNVCHETADCMSCHKGIILRKK
ncbi:MAG: hypothetical protein JXR89_04205 [Deltaproteobacteria bacterium]|nr:hypothetical protein [Deltaproteobacteria bacterium]